MCCELAPTASASRQHCAGNGTVGCPTWRTTGEQGGCLFLLSLHEMHPVPSRCPRLLSGVRSEKTERCSFNVVCMVLRGLSPSMFDSCLHWTTARVPQRRDRLSVWKRRFPLPVATQHSPPR